MKKVRDARGLFCYIFLYERIISFKERLSEQAKESKMFKRVISCILVVFVMLQLTTGFCFAKETENNEYSEAKSLILVEAKTGEVLFEQNPDEPLPPASVTKIMTLLLVIEAVDNKSVSLSDMVTVSNDAASMGGSQIYLEPGEQMTVEDMIKSVIIASANDAAYALAEHIAGSESEFVKRMNDRAKELGMKKTNFENTNGLDDTTQNHVTTARDIALMSAELIKHKTILKYTTIWQDTVRDGKFTLTNTNRLIRFYNGCNGLKTGSTSKAGFCMSATAERDGMQLIAVVMGAPTRDKRNNIAKKLLDFGFANYSYYKDQSSLDNKNVIDIKRSSVKKVKIGYLPYESVTQKEKRAKIDIKVNIPEYLTAPIKKGDIAGKITYTADGKTIAERDIFVLEDADEISFGRLFLLLIKKYLLI